MRPTVFQKAELRDENDNIVQQGTYGKGSALSNSTNDAWIDYVMNNLEALYGLAKDEVVPVSALPASGDMNKTYLLTTNGKTYRWSGTEWIELTNSEAVGRAETAANLAEQWATKIDGAVADNEYSAKYYANAAQQSADDAQDVADDMADHLAQIDQNTGGVSANSKRIGNIEKLLQGNLYDYDTDDDTAYTKTVPSGALPYAGIEKVGGKTVVWNQLAKNPTLASKNNVTVTKTGNMYTFTGTATAYSGFTLTPASDNLPVISRHKYYVGGSVTNENNALQVRLNVNFDGSTGSVMTTQNAILSPTASGKADIMLVVGNGKTVNATIYPMVIDLTLMFGAGNEPSTTAEVEAMFPADFYPYNAGTLLSAGVTSVVSKDGNNATLQTYSIPAEVQALEGYGWSAGSVSNYIDFERKVFVKNVGKIVLDGTQSISIANWQPTDNGVGWIYPYNATNNKIVDYRIIPNITSTKYTANGYESLQWHNVGISVYYLNELGLVIWQNDTSLNTATAINNYLSANPITVYYELATPVETDISQYLTDDNLINVESGGTLTFPNQNGTDYQIPVPSEEEYMIDLQASL